ncbi:Baseplate protein J-like [uncultured Caudovirales phage]|uniref:Baseplate protein J-like n=1 Tax=uncultured Caudovirales phage TaxID=2100421 RepID=A0A6J7W7U2_9CAUD|nr:Baseplate protein J-like [uncultured Caudovirales phage]
MKMVIPVSLTSNVPPIQFTDAGIVLPVESAILAGVQADINSAFGGGTNPSLETPQGQLASSETAIIADKNNQFAYFTNQIDPDYASGAWQDAIGRIYFLTRNPATSTSVSCTLTGISGTVIPAGALAKDVSGNTYANAGDVTIGSGGTVTATFNNVATGPISCASNSLTKIYQSISGWDAITNATAGSLGADVESRADFEFRRRNSVALNAKGTTSAIYANVFDVSGVTDCYVIDNPTSATVNTGVTSYPVAGHSVYVAVVGGVDTDIANAIWAKKDLGCDYNGNTTVNVTDTSGYNYPYPTYAVKFNRPTSIAIKFSVSIVNNSLLPSDITTQVKNAIIAKFNGADGSSRERIGAYIFASNYYSGITSLSPLISITSLQVAKGAGSLATSLQMGIDEAPTLQASDITVTLV